MAHRSTPHTTGSQFFITYRPAPELDPDFTVFGTVSEGMDVATSLTPRDPQRSPNAPPGDVIATIRVEEIPAQ
jgi:cyclophilin family peptidyl-prolyl cis-trans isomerase